MIVTCPSCKKSVVPEENKVFYKHGIYIAECPNCSKKMNVRRRSIAGYEQDGTGQIRRTETKEQKIRRRREERYKAKHQK